ncbi:MAG: nickel pincer cofactor biosynthesis protein LarC [Nocardioidaceae bacterium]
MDAASGASGDMLLGALIDARADQAAIGEAVAAVAPEAAAISSEHVQRGALAACRVYVDVADSSTHRGLSDVVELISAASIAPEVARHASAVFTRLAEAEASAHGVGVDEVHFHEVGALDAIADIVGVCAGFTNLGLERLWCGPIAVGSGSVWTAHGKLSVPPPAVALMLRGVPTYAGPVATELCTPTGAALLRHWVTDWGPQPLMSVEAIGVGAGGKDLGPHSNVVRLLLGSPSSSEPGSAHAGSAAPAHSDSLVYASNVDDLDPRLWPAILQKLLDAGASDAWLTPIVMKKGRPAHTLSALVRAGHADAVRSVIFAETSAIGLRETPVRKHELDRTVTSVAVDGQTIAVKLALSGGLVVNAQPEYDDVAAAAEALNRPAKSVLASALAKTADLYSDPGVGAGMPLPGRRGGSHSGLPE